MRFMGLVGQPGGGKTTLMLDLIPALAQRGLSVSTLLRARHADDIDRPGKDSYRHCDAGASEVMVTSARRWALIQHGAGLAAIDDLVARMSAVDLVIGDDVVRDGWPRIEVHRGEKAPLCRDDPAIVALVGDAAPANIAVPYFDRADISAIADFVADRRAAVG